MPLVDVCPGMIVFPPEARIGLPSSDRPALPTTKLDRVVSFDAKLLQSVKVHARNGVANGLRILHTGGSHCPRRTGVW